MVIFKIQRKGANLITKNNKTSKEKQLWSNWLDKKDSHAADELVKNYMYLVKFHVERIAITVPKSVNKSDLESFALLGLFDALKKFQPERELKFDTYASFRIRGSIIDGLRKEDWLPRSLREKTKQLEAITQELEQYYQREPTSEEIAERLGITTDEVESVVSDSLFSNILSIEGNTNDCDNDEGVGYSLPDEQMLSPEQHIVNLEVKSDLVEGIRGLNHSEKMVISLFYDDELTMTEIGEILELTTSRISQIHKKALFKLRNLLKETQTLS